MWDRASWSKAIDGPLADHRVDGSGRLGRRVIFGMDDIVAPSLVIVLAVPYRRLLDAVCNAAFDPKEINSVLLLTSTVSTRVRPIDCFPR